MGWSQNSYASYQKYIRDPRPFFAEPIQKQSVELIELCVQLFSLTLPSGDARAALHFFDERISLKFT
jgi:hypothetical protein